MSETTATRRQFLGGAGALALAAGAAQAKAAPLDPLLAVPGRDLAGMIAARKVSAVEALQSVLAQIARHNPAHNAVVALQDGDKLLAQARAMDVRLAAGEKPGALFGIPWAVKDLAGVIGIRTTNGSLVNKDNVPTSEGIMVQRLRAAGALFIGKTNAPEFGLGSHTINRVYGPTRNAWDPAKSAGGSSGGAGVGLALRMFPMADGSDFGGSLRNPAVWNNVFGFRTTLGTIPSEGPEQWISKMSTSGPMARTVADLGLILSVMAGPHPGVLGSLPVDARSFAGPLAAEHAKGLGGVRIGWLGDWGGLVPHDPAVMRICEGALPALRSIGCVVDEAKVDHEIEPVWQALMLLRSWTSGTGLQRYADNVATRDLIGPQAHWEIANSRSITGAQVLAASTVRTAWTRAVDKLFETHDFLIAPAVQLLPFPVEQLWPTEVAGKTMRTYHEWMLGTFLVTMTGLPALAAPAGFSADGLPAGIQIIGRRGADLACLRLAHAYEQAMRPVLSRLPLALI